MKEKSFINYIFEDSQDFMKSRTYPSIRKAEILMNLHSRYGFPSTSSKSIYLTLYISAIVMFLLINLMFFGMLVVTFGRHIAISTFLLLIIFGLLAVKVYLIRKTWSFATTPKSWFERLYEKLIGDGTIVHGKIEIVTRHHKYTHVIYRLMDDNRRFEFKTKMIGLADIGDKINVLYVNEKLHIPL